MTAAARNTPYDVMKIRADFPILSRQVHGKPLVYLDNGASAQKPRAVIDGMAEFYNTDYANIHRGVHYLSQVSTDRYEKVRDRVAKLLNAVSREEIVFTKNSTEAINLVAQSFARPFFKSGDEIVISHMEHHANIVPWQILAQQTGVVVRVVPIDDAGELRMDEFAKLLTGRTKLVAITHVSNVLGTITPAAEIVRMAHEKGIPVLLDGSQAVVHQKVDVRALDVDFYCFTGHKLYGPTGVGVLYGKAALLEKMPPYQGGGDMIASVSFEGTKFREPPYRFEAGTPAIAEVIGLGFAIDYVEKLGFDAIAAHEHDLLHYATAQLSDIPGIKIIGSAPNKCAIVSFTLGDVHPHDVGTIVDRQGVAIRAGHHCAEPLMQRFGVAATARASFALYNTRDEVDALAAALRKTQEMFA